MKKVLKIIGVIFLIIYAIVAILLTFLLLKYNDYNISVVNGKSFIIVRDEELKPAYDKGDLVIVDRGDNSEIKPGDKIFFYDVDDGKITVNLGNVIDKSIVNEREVTFVMDGDYPISSEYVIGKSSTSKSYSNLGSILSVLESRYGFLFIVIFPILILFIYEIYAAIKELKSPIDDE